MADNNVTTKFILEGDPTGLVNAMGKAQGAITGGFNTIGGSINKFVGIFGGLTAAMAGGAAFKAIVNETLNWNLEAIKLSKTLGITTEQASALNVALGDVFIEMDTMLAANSRITRTLNSNQQAFKDLGIEIKDGNNNYRSAVDIMADVNAKLLTMKEGTDRNLAATKIYGRGWQEVMNILKLTPEVMAEAEEKAERLHLLVGPEGVEKTKRYRAALNDLQDVHKSIIVQIGGPMMEVLAELGAEMEGPMTKAAGVLTDAMQALVEEIRAFKQSSSGDWWKPGAIADILTKTPGQLRSEADTGPTSHREVPTAPAGNRFGGGDKESESLLDKWKKERISIQSAIAEASGDVSTWDKAIIEANKKADELLVQYGKVPGAKKLIETLRAALIKKPELDAAREKWLAEITDEQEADKVRIQASWEALWESEGFLNSRGEMSKGQQNKFDEAARLSDWAARREASRQAELQAREAFQAEVASLEDQGYQQTLLNIGQQEEAAIQSWAMQTSSFEEYELRKFQIQNYYDELRKNAGISNEMQLAQTKQKINQNYLSAFQSLAQAAQTLAGGQFKALYVLTQAAAMATTFASTEAAAAAALAPPPLGLGPIAGAGLSASIRVAGYSSMAAIAATTLANVIGIGNGTQIGTGAGTPSSPIVTTNTGQTASNPLSVTVVIQGNVIGEDKWVQDNLAGLIKDAVNRNVDFGLQPA